MNQAITAAVLAAALLTGGASAATGLHKDVTLNVDGQVISGGGFALTVSDLLAARGIVLAEGDEVSPSPQTTLQDGDTVNVHYKKLVTLDVDGQRRAFHTTANTLNAALASAALQGELSGAKLSTAPDATVPRDGLSVTATTPKQIELRVAGEKSELTTTAATVADLLAAQGLSLGADDRISPSLDTRLAEGDEVKLDRVVVSTKTKTEAVAFKTVTKKNTSLWKGESRLLKAGKNGSAKRTYTITTVNGEVESKKLTTEDVKTKPVDRVLEVGTKVSANGVGLNLARAGMWDRIARCESGNNWSINTGNGYYGGLQFNLASWRANGGRDFAPYPHQASRAEQITVANRYYAKAGTRPWTCA